MTVAEFIELLQEFPQDYTVTFDNREIDEDSINIIISRKEVDFY